MSNEFYQFLINFVDKTNILSIDSFLFVSLLDVPHEKSITCT